MPMRNMFVVAVLLTVVAVEAKSVQNAKTMYYLRDDKLYRFKPPSLDAELLENDVMDFQLDADAQPVWMDFAAHVYRSHGEPVLRYKPSLPTARFAFDYSTNKFYVVDGDSQRIDVLQSDHERAVLFEGQPVRLNGHAENPIMIALDPSDGLMFVLTDHGGIRNIYRAHMDGTDKRKLARDVSSDELVVDPQERKIYWVNARRNIVENIGYEGMEGHQAIDGIGDVSNETAIAVMDGEIYWSVDGEVIYICDLIENSCELSTLRQVKLPPSNYPIKYLKLSYNSTPKEANICHSDNGGCQHMCLLNSRSNGTCVCFVDWEAHGKECKPNTSRRQTPWYHYMTPQPSWEKTTQRDPMRDSMQMASHIAIIGK